MVLGDGEALLQLERGLDEGGDETRVDVPFDVAVEEPDTCVTTPPSANCSS